MDTPARPASASSCRCGMSLVEVTIALGITGLLMVLVLDGMTSTTRYAVMAEQQDDLFAESQRITKSMADDFAASGWDFYDFDLAGVERQQRYYPYVFQQAPAGQAASPTNATLLGAGLPGHANWTYLARTTALVDWRQSTASAPYLNNLPIALGTSADFVRNYKSTYTSTTANVLGGTGEKDYRNTFYARSQEIVFLKASFATAWSTKTNNLLPTIPFPNGPTGPSTGAWTSTSQHDNLGILKMSEYTLGDASDAGAAPATGPDNRDPSTFYWDRPGKPFPKVYAAVNVATWLNDTTGAAGSDLVRMRWETRTNPGTDTTVFETPSTGTAANVPRITADAVREYTYAVVPSPLGGGRLVRAVKVQNPPALTTAPADLGACISRKSDGSVGMVVDRVLSDHVLRVVFDTAMTTPDGTTTGSLEMNQVRVRLYMAASSPQNLNQAITRTYDAVLSMRTTNSGIDNQTNYAMLSGGTVKALPR